MTSQEGPTGPARISLRERFARPQTFIALALALAFLVFIFTRFDVDLSDTWRQIMNADPVYYVLAVAAYYASFPLRAVRWKALLRNAGLDQGGKGLPGTGSLVQMLLLNWFANVILFARVGDIYRPYMLREETGIPYSRSLGTVVAERIIDVLVVVVLLAAAAVALLSAGTRAVGFSHLVLGLALAGFMLLALLVLWRFGRLVERLLPGRLRLAWCSFRDCTLGSLRQMPFPVLTTALAWVAEVMRLYLVALALGVNMPVAYAFFVALAYAVAVALPTTPGGLGLVEGGMAGLLSLSMAQTLAWSVTILDRSITFLSLIVVGLGIFGWRELRRMLAGRRKLLV